jgi:phospho-N-acetylmuramoyl-pentapeptide-transferase
MLYHLASLLMPYFGPARLLQSYAVLIVIALYAGYALTVKLLPSCGKFLPRDRGREFTPTAGDSQGKPTGAGAAFITLYALIVLVTAPLKPVHICVLALTWLTMFAGFLDDKSESSWGEYRKGLIDLIVSLLASFAIAYFFDDRAEDGIIRLWLPFVTQTIVAHPAVFIALSTIIIWASINTTNCTDGVDGLSGTLVLIALITMGLLFYIILGHKDISAYLLVPHLADGAVWGLMAFSLAGILMGYLWHNAYPSSVLMGDAGSRALGFFIGVSVMVAGNPFLILATSTIIAVNGGMGLIKIFLLRFFKIRVFTTIRFPLHDHVRHNSGWSSTQVLIRFVILQILITIALLGIFVKVR